MAEPRKTNDVVADAIAQRRKSRQKRKKEKERAEKAALREFPPPTEVPSAPPASDPDDTPAAPPRRSGDKGRRESVLQRKLQSAYAAAADGPQHGKHQHQQRSGKGATSPHSRRSASTGSNGAPRRRRGSTVSSRATDRQGIELLLAEERAHAGQSPASPTPAVPQWKLGPSATPFQPPPGARIRRQTLPDLPENHPDVVMAGGAGAAARRRSSGGDSRHSVGTTPASASYSCSECRDDCPHYSICSCSDWASRSGGAMSSRATSSRASSATSGAMSSRASSATSGAMSSRGSASPASLATSGALSSHGTGSDAADPTSTAASSQASSVPGDGHFSCDECVCHCTRCAELRNWSEQAAALRSGRSVSIHTGTSAQTNASLYLSDGLNSHDAGERMTKAYEMTRLLLHDRLARERPPLSSLTDEDVLVVSGHYDHMEKVLDLLQVPYRKVLPLDLHNVFLGPLQTVFVNCAMKFKEGHAFLLRDFVQAGGTLVTTDWGLRNILEVAFPGFVKHNGQETGDTVVPVRAAIDRRRVLIGFYDEAAGARPMWWLEHGSLPVTIVDNDAVEVLVDSEEMQRQYGSGAVIVSFPFGRGRVYHMVSHVFLQRTEQRYAKHKTSAKAYGTAKHASKATLDRWNAEADRYSDVDYGTIQSAQTSAELVARIILEQKAKGPTLLHMINRDTKAAAKHGKRASTASQWSTTLGVVSPFANDDDVGDGQG